MALIIGQTVGPEVIFAPDPIGHVPRVTPLADGSFILAWQSDTGDLVAKHLNSAGSFTTGDFLLDLSSFAAAQNWALTTPLIVQGRDGSITTDFSVLNQQSLLTTVSNNNRTFTVLLAAVAAISLLVGGIGVMNIMLVTVTERTREIGIRKAVGARQGHILTQFLVEAVLLAGFGGMVGAVSAIALAGFVTIQNVTPVVEPYSVFLALGFAVATGLFFGIYPANRAAKLRPIDALRYE